MNSPGVVEGFAVSLESLGTTYPAFNRDGPGCRVIPAPASCFTCPPNTRLATEVGRSTCEPSSAPGPTPDRSAVTRSGVGISKIGILLGLAVGVGLAYITYDETMGTGAYLRRSY